MAQYGTEKFIQPRFGGAWLGMERTGWVRSGEVRSDAEGLGEGSNGANTITTVYKGAFLWPLSITRWTTMR